MHEIFAKNMLSSDDFARLHGEKRLGTLFLPNGEILICHHPEIFDGSEELPLTVSLEALYRLIVGRGKGSEPIDPEKIAAVVAVGKAVEFPGYREVRYERKKYLFFGTKISRVVRERVRAFSAGIVVFVEGSTPEEDRYLEPEFVGACECSMVLQRGGIHVLYRSLKATLDEKDITLLRNGVPLVFDKRLLKAYKRNRIHFENPREVEWYEDKDLRLSGNVR